MVLQRDKKVYIKQMKIITIMKFHYFEISVCFEQI